MNNEIPFVSFGNEELENCITVEDGQQIPCPYCVNTHELETATDKETGEKTKLLMFFKCGNKLYLGAVNGRMVIGLKRAE